MMLVNTSILSEPYNWIVVGLIAAFWLLFLCVVSPQQDISNG